MKLLIKRVCRFRWARDWQLWQKVSDYQLNACLNQKQPSNKNIEKRRILMQNWASSYGDESSEDLHPSFWDCSPTQLAWNEWSDLAWPCQSPHLCLRASLASFCPEPWQFDQNQSHNRFLLWSLIYCKKSMQAGHTESLTMAVTALCRDQKCRLETDWLLSWALEMIYAVVCPGIWPSWKACSAMWAQKHDFFWKN